MSPIMTDLALLALLTGIAVPLLIFITTVLIFFPKHDAVHQEQRETVVRCFYLFAISLTFFGAAFLSWFVSARTMSADWTLLGAKAVFLLAMLGGTFMLFRTIAIWPAK